MSNCDQCGASLGEGKLKGLCPSCMLLGALQPEPDLDEAESGLLPSDPAPEPSEVADRPAPEAVPAPQPTPHRGGLEIRCPQCARLIDLPPGAPLSGVCCDSCGTHFNIVDDAAAAAAADDLGKIGPFQILERLGSGAFGTVWKARDTRLDRLVAIKVPLRRRLPPAEAEKFLREARAAAQLHHPHIVSVHEVGRDEELIYIVCDYVEGLSLAEWLRTNRMSAREAARFCVALADALEHAHEAGVIHRDLKPQNVMLDAAGKPHLTDFGLARRQVGEATLTVEGALLGTPAYMSPEQARGEGHHADRRTDLYSLGVILFQLLTGELPFRGNARMLVHQVLHDEAPSPRKLNGHIPRDLETICLKCLQKEPSRRYETAGDLRDDLRLFLSGEPIRARPISTVTRTWRWCQRKPVLAGLALAVMALAALSSTAAVRMAIEREGRERELYRSSIQLADAHLREGNIDLALATLLDCPEKYRHWEWGYLIAECHREVRVLDDAVDAELQKTPSWIAITQPWECAFDRMGERVAALHPSGGVWIWDLTSGTLVAHTRQPANPGVGVLLTGDWSQVIFSNTNGIQVAPVTGTGPARTLESSPAQVDRLLLDPTGSTLTALDHQDRVHTWDLDTGQWLHSFDVLPTARRLHFTADGQRLVVASGKEMGVYSVSSGVLLQRADTGEHTPLELFPAPDADRFVTADVHNRFHLWTTNGQVSELGIGRGGNRIRNTAFTRDGRLFATGGDDGSGGVREAATGRLIFSLPAQAYGLWWNLDGTRLVTAGGSSLIHLWDVENHREAMLLKSHPDDIHDVAYSPDGRLLASISRFGHLKVWSATAGRESLLLLGFINGSALAPDDRHLAIVNSSHGKVFVWDTHTGRQAALFKRQRRVPCGYPAYSPDGRLLAAGGFSGEVCIWEPATGSLLHVLRGHTAWSSSTDFSPDGRLLASGSADGTVRIWEVQSGKPLQTFRDHSNWVGLVKFTPDGRHVLAASFDPSLRIWEVSTGRCRTIEVDARVAVATTSPDGSTLVVLCLDRTIRFLDARSGQFRKLWKLRGIPYQVAYSPDGQRMVLRAHRSDTVSEPPSLEVWNVARGQPLLVFRDHGGMGGTAHFSADGMRILGDWSYGRMRQWEAFPWRGEEYPDVGDQSSDVRGQRAEIGGQRSEVRDQSKGKAEPGSSRSLDKAKERLALRIRRYADSYWQQRLAAEHQGILAGSELEVDLPMDRTLIDPRDPAASPDLIDLTAHYNAPVQELSHPVGSQADWDVDFRHLPRGIVEFNEVPFDVRGIIQLNCELGWGTPSRIAWADIPQRVEGVPIGRAFRRIHALLGTPYGASHGSTIGTLILRYSNGSHHDLPILFGRHVLLSRARDHWNSKIDLGRLAWEGSNPCPNWMNAHHARVRLYQCHWDNPHPELEVLHLDFVSTMTTSPPFLVALTVE